MSLPTEEEWSEGIRIASRYWPDTALAFACHDGKVMLIACGNKNVEYLGEGSTCRNAVGNAIREARCHYRFIQEQIAEGNLQLTECTMDFGPIKAWESL